MQKSIQWKLRSDKCDHDRSDQMTSNRHHCQGDGVGREKVAVINLKKKMSFQNQIYRLKVNLKLLGC
jgi:hypothetical protein